MGWESHYARSELRDLRYNDRQTGSRSGANSTVLVEFSNPAFHLRSPGDLTAEEQDSVCECDSLYKRVKKQEERVRYQTSPSVFSVAVSRISMTAFVEKMMAGIRQW